MLTIPGEKEPIGVILETKLLGYWLTSDMKSHKRVQYIVSRSMKRIFAIRRLKSAGCVLDDLVYMSMYCSSHPVNLRNCLPCISSTVDE